MSAISRGEVLEQARRRYGGRGKEGRGRLLDEVCALCGYERRYASKVLRGQRPIAGSDGRRRGGSQALYGEAERAVIKAIWLRAEQPCGKRLKAALGLWLPHYQRRKGRLTRALKSNVLAISAATIDRLLAPCRVALGSRGRSGLAPALCCAVRSPSAPSTGR
jgi:hypothetical protein